MNTSPTAVVTSVFLLAAALPAAGQQPPNPDYVRIPIYSSYEQFRTALTDIVNLPDPVMSNAQLNTLWQQLSAAGQIPFAIGDRVAFLYRGSANTVAWRGDFNSWGIAQGQRLGDSNVWILERTLPADARSDYKLFLNNSTWTLDTGNSLHMWSGFGPNSELRMPDYIFPRETVRRPDVPQGILTPDLRIHSDQLGYDVNYRVYTPPAYDQLDDLPVVYVTDGHEYAADYLGSMTIVMDNLIADGRMRPAIAVFIDPRDPEPPHTNRRQTEYVGNPQYAAFLADELVPRIDADYETDGQASARAILGTSLGGLNSMYVGMVEHDTFGLLGIQSPAFQMYTAIYDLVRNHPHRDQTIFMTAGTLGNDNAAATTMRQILEDHNYTFHYLEVHEGHSWGAWRGQLDSLLEATIGPPVPEPNCAFWSMALVGAALRRSFPFAAR